MLLRVMSEMRRKTQDKNSSPMDGSARAAQCGVMIIIAIALIAIIAPFAINIGFQTEASCALFSAQWSAGDLLVYCGSVFSGLGTLLLGALTLYQNKLLRDETDKRIQAEKAREYATFMPTIGLQDRNVFGDAVILEVSNFSFASIKDIAFSDIRGMDNDGNAKWTFDDELLPMLLPGESNEVQIGYLNNEHFLTQQPLETIEMKMTCVNQLGFRYSFSIQGTAKETKTFGNPKRFQWQIEPIIA